MEEDEEDDVPLVQIRAKSKKKRQTEEQATPKTLKRTKSATVTGNVHSLPYVTFVQRKAQKYRKQLVNLLEQETNLIFTDSTLKSLSKNLNYSKSLKIELNTKRKVLKILKSQKALTGS
jgi:hypothetical protein